MNKEQAERLVDKWAHDWRTYLDGKLHRLARAALVYDIVAATSVSADDASEDLEGKTAKPMTEAELRMSFVRQVQAEDEAKRAKAAAAAKAEQLERQADADVAADGAADVDQVQDAAAVLPDKPDDLADGAASAAALAAADALALLQDVAREERRPFMLTPSQVERFNRFGLLAGLKYQVTEPMPVETGGAVDPKRKPGRPPRQR